MKSFTNHTPFSVCQLLAENKAIKILFGTFLMFLCSQVNIPLNPVPITLQTVGALIIGLTYRKNDAASAIGLFLLLGALGAPVFSSFSGGIEKFFLSTGGYLIGMLCSAYIIAYLREKFGDDSAVQLITYSIIGQTIIFVLGLSWLANLIGIHKAIQFGLIPFIAPGIVKCLFAASSVSILKNISLKTKK